MEVIESWMEGFEREKEGGGGGGGGRRGRETLGLGTYWDWCWVPALGAGGCGCTWVLYLECVVKVGEETLRGSGRKGLIGLDVR